MVSRCDKGEEDRAGQDSQISAIQKKGGFSVIEINGDEVPRTVYPKANPLERQNEVSFLWKDLASASLSWPLNWPRSWIV